MSSLCYHEKSTTKNRLQSLRPDAEHRKVRELPRKMHIEAVELAKSQKSTSFVVKTSLKSIPEPRKVRELPGKMNIEEVEEPRKHENYHRNPFRAPQTHEKYENYHEKEHRRSRRAGNCENLQTKPASDHRRHPKTTKIHRQNEHASTKPRK